MRITVPFWNAFRARYVPTPTTAWMVGRYLAVHRGRNAEWWSVIHVPTLCALEIDLVSKASALRLAHRVKHLNWNFRTATSRLAKATIKLAKPLVRGK